LCKSLGNQPHRTAAMSVNPVTATTMQQTAYIMNELLRKKEVWISMETMKAVACV